MKSSAGWLWVLVYLLLPDCHFTPGAVPENLNTGSLPHSSVIFCDIEQALGRHCATAADKISGLRLSQAAVALVQRHSSNIGLDYSAEARKRCGGEPEAVTFKCLFPNGCAICLNCAVIGHGGGLVPPGGYAEPKGACVAHCEDIFGPGPIEVPPAPVVRQFCEQHADVSTNSSRNTCFDDACTNAGELRSAFVDPRRTPEPVHWTDAISVDVNLNSLSRSLVTGVSAGAASQQFIARGDGYVEFTATETNTARSCGLTSGVFPGVPDTDPTEADMRFAIRLSGGGNIRILESGVAIPGPVPPGNFGPYAAGDRLRLTVTDNFDGTATVGYFRIPAACGAQCDGSLLRTAGPAPYPFRVDASLPDQGATLTDVRVVRIK